MKQLMGFEFNDDVAWASMVPNVDGTITVDYERRNEEMGKVQCLECGKILESKFTHDFQMCSCPQGTFVDGGDDYLRIGGKDLDKIKVIKDESNED